MHTATELHQAWATKVRERRTRVGLTQTELGERAGIHQSTVAKFERCGIASDEVKLAIADALKIDAGKLFSFRCTVKK